MFDRRKAEVWTDTNPSGRKTVSHVSRAGTAEALRSALLADPIDGIATVRLMPSEARYEHAHDKVYFVLMTHDIERDEKIVRLMVQFDGVDYDLVPRSAAGMVPSGAIAVV